MKTLICSLTLTVLLLEGEALAAEQQPALELSRTVSEKTRLVLGRQVGREV
jgi:hypothetical protein